MTLTKDEMFDAITVERHRLADVLDGLESAQWDTPSLCGGWSVRDVLGHLLSILEVPVWKFLVGSVRRRSFDRYADEVACQLAASAGPGELVARFRARAATRFAPPVVGPIAPLVDICVHAHDIGWPLGAPVALDAATLGVALDFCCGSGRGFVPRSRTAGLRFQATDLDWSSGEGVLVEGPADALLLAVTDRPAALAKLSGPGAAILAERLG
ncbi:MAG: maleylpyruvate isomerase family mycothiol-dependent enzyme [Acidimicrobiia bacterium]|nr:maleylpyruvate isomerase family mycothiol-dependent enzyme [Acidimicrobiia bacterium]